MDCISHGVAKSQTRLSEFHFHCTLKGQGEKNLKKKKGQGEANGNRANQFEKRGIPEIKGKKKKRWTNQSRGCACGEVLQTVWRQRCWANLGWSLVGPSPCYTKVERFL